MSERGPLADTIERQHKASDPRHSAWVRANAGSGKTHVLAQRVIRLLLRNVAPSRILCLTFTRAAAANMSMRVFNMLAGWATMEDAQLRQEIAKAGAEIPDDLDAARRLFARAVETPGGLKIQTIHAFCERLLHLFPFEANVAARFEAMEEDRQKELLVRARQSVIRDATHDPESAAGRALARITQEVNLGAFETILSQAMGKRELFRRLGMIEPDGIARDMRACLGLQPDDSRERIEQEIVAGGIAAGRLREIVDALSASSANDVKCADRLRPLLDPATSEQERIAVMYDAFYTTSGTLRKSMATQKFDSAMAGELQDEQQRFVQLFGNLLAARIVERSAALVIIAGAVFEEYERYKNQHGLLDFEDLIVRVQSLLARSDARWVLYKLDAGIDHILVDEAQDTSPAQWEILKALVEDFFAGEGARTNVRTFFAVGDEKQSIFSFQGAQPREFGKNLKAFQAQVEQANLAFNNIELQMSFRSTKTVLRAVDEVFADPGRRAGLVSGDDVAPRHEAWKPARPGLVELWPAVQHTGSEEPEDWRLPLDHITEQAPAVVLAQRVARKVAALVAPGSGEAVFGKQDEPRRITPGDIMILVRRRGDFFDAVIRALKDNNVPVAGADRLKVMDHIAIMDLAAAGHAALLPQDDLALACVLKSPLIGLDDNDLITIAPGRETDLFSALHSSADPRHAAAYDRILDWSRLARTATPFQFYSQMLGAEGGRARLLARLGLEADDAIGEFLRLALSFERDNPPSLALFLNAVQAADPEIKRDMEAAGEAVRVMTVHAAKGLEAPVVFLPDTCSKPSGNHDPALVEIAGADNPGPLLFWRTRKAEDTAQTDAAVQDARQAQEEEHRRLFYVALTRAAERLYICGYEGRRPRPSGCWYDMAEASLSPQATPDPAFWSPEEQVLRLGEGARLPATDDGAAGEQLPPAAGPSLSSLPSSPDWLKRPLPPEEPVAPPVRPSNTLAAADQLDPVADGGPAASAEPGGGILFGQLVHDLLQYLPDIEPARRPEAIERFLNARASGIPAAARKAAVEQTLAVLQDASIAPLFGAGSRAEIPLAGTLSRTDGSELEISGRIDRIAVLEDAVLIADFKTGGPAGAGSVPAVYVRQMALYRAVLQKLFPGRDVRALLIWTSGPIVQEIAAEAMDGALAAILSPPS